MGGRVDAVPVAGRVLGGHGGRAAYGTALAQLLADPQRGRLLSTGGG